MTPKMGVKFHCFYCFCCCPMTTLPFLSDNMLDKVFFCGPEKNIKNKFELKYFLPRGNRKNIVPVYLYM